jgi:hypothetical protein
MVTLQGTSLNTRQTRKLATVVPNMPSALTAAGKWNLQRTGQWQAAAVRDCIVASVLQFGPVNCLVVFECQAADSSVLKCVVDKQGMPFCCSSLAASAHQHSCER